MDWNEWLKFFVAGWGLLFTVYVLFQILAIILVQGQARTIVSIPAIFAVVVLILTLSAYDSGSNLWPILLILFSPLAIVFVAGTWLIQFFKQRRSN